ncbi:MAG: glycoside hydrolase family 31 protein [Proteobacteria bacterium]|nr:glycoside hydrolase family 31 protein [Pseudomonadota bacterium]
MGETIMLEAWGPHALRLRARPAPAIREPVVDALLPQRRRQAAISIAGTRARIANGKIAAELSITHRYGADVRNELVIRYVNAKTGEELLAETRPHFAGPGTRSFRPLASDSFRLEACFKAYDGERLYGLGQPQHGLLDLKGVSTSLLQQNTHVVIPFVISSRGYGFIWHNPATGRVDFARNLTRWTADATAQLDYWITAGDSPAELVRRYADVTGHAPQFPEWAAGFWQSRLRYRTQDELLRVAREYKRRKLPLACIVIDFFHWTRMGEWQFDPADWPDPKKMMAELRKLGVKLMVSIWPTVAPRAETYSEMRERGFLMRSERGAPVANAYPDKHPLTTNYITYYDATLPAARDYVWQRVKKNYLAYGIDNFWLDSCEPELRPNHPENVRLALGSGAEVLNAYPLLHAQGFREGLTKAGRGQAATLLARSAWLGSQKHGVILWSGDIWSSWQDLRAQITAGMSVGLAGIGWWTTDIGGFFDGVGKDPDFRELLVRWFEFGVFSPVCRLHGCRVPDALRPAKSGMSPYGEDMAAIFTDTGGANELWSFGAEVYVILKRLLALRETLRPYVMRAMKIYSATGDPLMRPLFYDFPKDAQSWTIEDEYLFGPDLLVAPVTVAKARKRRVYLPAGTDWRHAWSAETYPGGTNVAIEAPLGQIPVFIRDGADIRLA